MRELSCPEQGGRVETGAVQFGDDWPGLFLRGDDCARLLLALENACSIVQRHDPSFATELTVIMPLTEIVSTIRKDVIVGMKEEQP